MERLYHSTKEQKARDRRKNAYLKKNGWKVLRFQGSRITRDLNGVVRKIEREKELISNKTSIIKGKT